MNGVVEWSFVTNQDCAYASMLAARFTSETRNILWAEAIHCSTTIRNLTPLPNRPAPFVAWPHKNNKILEFLQPFGRVAYVTIRVKIRAKFVKKSTKCVFVEYAADHSPDSYRFYNPETRKVFISRDVEKWMEWHSRSSATDNLELFEQSEELWKLTILPGYEPNQAPDVPIINNETALPAQEDPPTEIIFDLPPPEPDILPTAVPLTAPTATQPVEAPSNAEPTVLGSPDTGIVPTARAGRQETTRLERELACLHTGYNPTVLSSSMANDPPTGWIPKDWKHLYANKALDDNGQWLQSHDDEFANFFARDAWEIKLRSDLPPGKKTLNTRTLFKLKSDGLLRSYKARD